jgi:uncharacterized protein
MKILDHLISTLNFEGSVKDIRQGVFHTAVLSRNCGLAATLPMDSLRQIQPMVIDAVCGTKVVDPELVMQCVSQGANFRQIKGTRRLTLVKAIDPALRYFYRK